MKLRARAASSRGVRAPFDDQELLWQWPSTSSVRNLTSSCVPRGGPSKAIISAPKQKWADAIARTMGTFDEFQPTYPPPPTPHVGRGAGRRYRDRKKNGS